MSSARPAPASKVYAFDYWVTLTDHEDIRSLARRLYAEGNEVHIVSSISPGLPLDSDDAYDQMLKQMNVPYTAIHRVDHDPKLKIEVLKRIKADEFWDDLKPNVDAAIKAGFKAHWVAKTDGFFLTNRCSKCGRALTKLEILERFNSPKPLCPCGSNKFHSSNFKWWEELFLPRSWKAYFAWKRGELLPPPTKREVAENRLGMMKEVMGLQQQIDDEEESAAAKLETDANDGWVRNG